MAPQQKKRALNAFLRFNYIIVMFLLVWVCPNAYGSSFILPDLEKGISKESPRHAESLQLLRRNSFDQVIDLETKNLRTNPNDRGSSLLLALAYLGKGDAKAAQDQAVSLSKIDPAYAARLYQNMGVFYTYKQKFFRALHCFQSAISLSEDPAVFNQVAAVYLAQDRLEKAKSYLLRSLPDTVDYINLSRIALAEKDYPASIDFAQKAISAKPKSTEAYLLSGTAQLLSGRLAPAEADFKRVKELKPDMVLADYNLGLIHLAQEKYDRALADFDQMIARAPKIKEAHLGRAVALHLMGNTEKAQSAAEQAIQADSGDLLGHLTLANIYLSNNRYIEADKAFRAAGGLFVEFTLPRFQSKDQLGFSSAKAAASFSLVNLYYRNGMFEQALKTLQTAFGRQTESNYFLTVTAARAERMRGNAAGAKQLLGTAERLYPKPVSAHMEMGHMAAAASDLQQAVASYEKASELEPQLSQLHFILGDLFLQMNDAPRAIDRYKRGLALDPKSGAGLNQLAWTLSEKEGRHSEALPLAQKAAQVAPASPKIKDTLAWIQYRMGQREKAGAIYSEIAKAPLKDPVVFYHMGVVFQETGRKKEAAKAFENALNITEEFAHGPDAEKRLSQLGAI